MKILRHQLLTTDITLLKEVVSSVLEIRPYTTEDMHSEDIFINSLVLDMSSPQTKLKLHQQ